MKNPYSIETTFHNSHFGGIISCACLGNLGGQLKKGRKYLPLSFHSFTKAEGTLAFSSSEIIKKLPLWCEYRKKKVSLGIAHRFLDMPKENKQEQMKMLAFSSGLWETYKRSILNNALFKFLFIKHSDTVITLLVQ